MLLYYKIIHYKLKDQNDDSDDDDVDNDHSEVAPLHDDDLDLPATFKDKKVYLKGLRIDAVASAGLNISRRFLWACDYSYWVVVWGSYPLYICCFM